jgi:hypothetical protein
VRPRVGCGALPLSDASAAIALSKRLRSGWSSLIAESKFAIRDCSTVICDCSQAYEPQQNRSPLALWLQRNSQQAGKEDPRRAPSFGDGVNAFDGSAACLKIRNEQFTQCGLSAFTLLDRTALRRASGHLGSKRESCNAVVPRLRTLNQSFVRHDVGPDNRQSAIPTCLPQNDQKGSASVRSRGARLSLSPKA